jgi:DNA-binding transcriptional LysR family regulator
MLTMRPLKINIRIFAEIDLNLMVVFMVIYDERNVSRAALKLGVGQPAVSGSLVRLRARFGDPLFERTGSGMEPTAKAHDIARQLAPAIRTIESILGQR